MSKITELREALGVTPNEKETTKRSNPRQNRRSDNRKTPSIENKLVVRSGAVNTTTIDPYLLEQTSSTQAVISTIQRDDGTVISETYRAGYDIKNIYQTPAMVM